MFEFLRKIGLLPKRKHILISPLGKKEIVRKIEELLEEEAGLWLSRRKTFNGVISGDHFKIMTVPVKMQSGYISADG